MEKISILYGSVRTHRLGIRAVKYLSMKFLEKGYDVSIIDPIEMPLPLIDKMYKEYSKGEAPEAMEKIAEILRQSDGFIVVSGEYNHTIPPALINLLDHFQKEFAFKPSAIATYSSGEFGGVRVIPQLRSILGKLGTPGIASMFIVQNIENSIDENGISLDEYHDKQFIRFFKELDWYLKALKEARKNDLPF